MSAQFTYRGIPIERDDYADSFCGRRIHWFGSQHADEFGGHAHTLRQAMDIINNYLAKHAPCGPCHGYGIVSAPTPLNALNVTACWHCGGTGQK